MLKERFDIEHRTTTGRDAGIGIAREAAESGVPLVIAFGGDGHVNEVANGLAGSDTPLGIVPGGTMNVFVRSLRIPTDPFAAVKHLCMKFEQGTRRVPLGRMNERYFTFAAGCGFDAEAAERVERDLPAKKRFGELFFYWSAFRVLCSSYRHRRPEMMLRGPFGEIPIAMAVACNAGPYAYLAGREIHLAPEVQLDRGLDIFAMRTMRIEALPIYAWRCVVSGDLVHHPDVFYANNVESFELITEKPAHRHTDGEPLPTSTHVNFSIERDILKVVA